MLPTTGSATIPCSYRPDIPKHAGSQRLRIREWKGPDAPTIALKLYNECPKEKAFHLWLKEQKASLSVIKALLFALPDSVRKELAPQICDHTYTFLEHSGRLIEPILELRDTIARLNQEISEIERQILYRESQIRMLSGPPWLGECFEALSSQMKAQIAQNRSLLTHKQQELEENLIAKRRYSDMKIEVVSRAMRIYDFLSAFNTHEPLLYRMAVHGRWLHIAHDFLQECARPYGQKKVPDALIS